MAKPPIPDANMGLTGEARKRFDRAVKERLEIISGERGGRIESLPETATLDDVISVVNAILGKWQ